MREPMYERLRCRLCNYHRFPTAAPVFQLPPTPLANAFCKTRAEAQALQNFPLTVHQCPSCGHHQLGHIVDAELMFSEYAYASGTSASFRQHFNDYAKEVRERYPDASSVLEIGSNDGVMLHALQNVGFTNVLGVEPARNLSQLANAKGFKTLNAFFSERLIQEHSIHADVWVANNVMAHIDSFVPTMQALALTDATAGVFEVQYLGAMLRGGHFDNIYHEHLDYWLLRELYKHLQYYTPWVVTDAQVVPTHGGSLRIWVTHRSEVPTQRPSTASMKMLLDEEKAHDWKRDWAALEQKMEVERRFLHASLGDNQRIAVFGAPAKLTSLMYGLKLTNLNFSYVVDDSTLKQGLFTPGMGLEVFPAQKLLQDPPEVVLVAAWNFADSILRKLNEMGVKAQAVVPFKLM